MSKRKKTPAWEDFKEKVCKKRTGGKSKEETQNGVDYLTVQRLSASVEDKCQKYSRIGPLTMVPINSEATLQNIKDACKKHFQATNMDCDILAGERGPSYTEASQIKDWKVLHIRFIELNNTVPRSDAPDRKGEPHSSIRTLQP